MAENKENKWTRLEDIEQAIARFLTEKKYPESIVLSGNWGVGKSFLWNQIVSESPTYARKYYIYVSLFGVSSLSDLKYKLFESKQDWPKTEIGAEESSEEEPLKGRLEKFKSYFSKESIDQLTGSDRGIIGKVAMLKDLPVASRVEPIVRSMAFNTVKNAIVCIDDFERRSQELRAVDVLGLASYLRESRNCKVALIHNEDALDTEKDEFDRYEEKVFDWRIVFNPATDHAIDAIIPEMDEYRSVWTENAELLGINNIRIIRRTYEQVKIIEEYFPNTHPEIRKQFVRSLLLFNFSKFGDLPHIPGLEYIRSYGRSYLDENEDEDEVEAVVLWKNTMSALNWSSVDELDLELIEIVEKGYVSKDRLQIEIERKMNLFADAEAQAELENAWRLYYGSFQDNGEEVAVAIYAAVNKHLGLVSAMNVDATIRLLRDLDKDTEATRIADAFVELYRDDPKVLNINESSFGDELKDTYLLDRLSDALQQVPDDKDLEEVLLRLVRVRSWGGSDEEFLVGRSEEDFVEFLTNYTGDRLPSLIKGALIFSRMSNPSDRMAKIGQKVTGALETIAASSSINARRLERYGFKPKDVEATPD